jgi:hypothetical protein
MSAVMTNSVPGVPGFHPFRFVGVAVAFAVLIAIAPLVALAPIVSFIQGGPVLPSLPSVHISALTIPTQEVTTMLYSDAAPLWFAILLAVLALPLCGPAIRRYTPLVLHSYQRYYQRHRHDVNVFYGTIAVFCPPGVALAYLQPLLGLALSLIIVLPIVAIVTGSIFAVPYFRYTLDSTPRGDKWPGAATQRHDAVPVRT